LRRAGTSSWRHDPNHANEHCSPPREPGHPRRTGPLSARGASGPICPGCRPGYGASSSSWSQVLFQQHRQGWGGIRGPDTVRGAGGFDAEGNSCDLSRARPGWRARLLAAPGPPGSQSRHRRIPFARPGCRSSSAGRRQISSARARALRRSTRPGRSTSATRIGVGKAGAQQFGAGASRTRPPQATREAERLRSHAAPPGRQGIVFRDVQPPSPGPGYTEGADSLLAASSPSCGGRVLPDARFGRTCHRSPCQASEPRRGDGCVFPRLGPLRGLHCAARAVGTIRKDWTAVATDRPRLVLARRSGRARLARPPGLTFQGASARRHRTAGRYPRGLYGGWTAPLLAAARPGQGAWPGRLAPEGWGPSRDGPARAGMPDGAWPIRSGPGTNRPHPGTCARAFGKSRPAS